MSREVTVARRAAGQWAPRAPYRLPIDVAAPTAFVARRAIYLAYSADRTLHYIGKVDRPSEFGSIGRRLNEHLRESLRKRRAWQWLWVVELDERMPAGELLMLERSLIRRYRSPGNVQHVPRGRSANPRIFS